MSSAGDRGESGKGSSGVRGRGAEGATGGAPQRRGPFVRLQPRRFRLLLWISGASALALFAALWVIDLQISSTEGPGILALEVAGSPSRAGVILSEWGADGIRWARISLLLDFPFLLAYATFLAATCTALTARLAPNALRDAGSSAGSLARIAPGMGWAALLAGACDVIENIALLRVIEFSLTPWAGLAQLMAALKFTLLGATLALIAASTLVLALRSRSSTGDT